MKKKKHGKKWNGKLDPVAVFVFVELPQLRINFFPCYMKLRKHTNVQRGSAQGAGCKDHSICDCKTSWGRSASGGISAVDDEPHNGIHIVPLITVDKCWFRLERTWKTSEFEISRIDFAPKIFIYHACWWYGRRPLLKCYLRFSHMCGARPVRVCVNENFRFAMHFW